MSISKLDLRQSRYRAILQTLGLAADTTSDIIIASIDKELDYPLRPRTNLVPNASLYFSDAVTDNSDGSSKVLGALNNVVYTAPTGLSIDYQARTVSNVSYFDVLFPASTVGQYRRVAFFFTKDGKIKAAYSAEAATQGALANAGTLIPTSNVIPLGYLDLVCTDALGSFKSATAATNIIQPIDLYRFAAGAGGGGGAGTTFDTNQVAHGFSVLDPIYFDGSSWLLAQANNANTLASYIVVEVQNADQFTAANFGVFDIPNALIPGEYYFCSDTVAGGIQLTEPLTGYSNPVLFCESATLIHATCYRPSAIGDGIASDSDIGAIIAFPNTTPPAGYLYCDGNSVSRVTYADLFTMIGTKYGQGDGVNTFNLPDLRGYSLRGATATMGGVTPAASVSTGSDTFTITGHNFQHSGVMVRISTSGGMPGGLSSGTAYWVIVVDPNTVKFASTLANALSGTNIDITTQGTGNHTVSQFEDPDAASRFARAPGGTTGSGAGSYQDDAFEDHVHNLLVGVSSGSGMPWHGSTPGSEAQFTQGSTSGGSETRAKNLSVGFFIRWAARGAIKGVTDLLEINGTTSGTVSISAIPVTTSYSLILPATQSVGTKVLQNDGAGNLSWAAAVGTPSFVGSSYYLSGNISVSTGSQIDFNTSDFDIGAAVTTGASWKYTAAATGYYGIGGNLHLTSVPSAGDLTVYKNNSPHKRIVVFNLNEFIDATLSATVFLTAGDFIDIRPSATVNLSGLGGSSGDNSTITVTFLGV